MSQNDPRIPSLDGLRAVSIVMVLGGHLMMFSPASTALSYLAPLFDGALGVRMFFVISGFLISLLLQREETSSTGDISLTNFYIRRFLRLAPVQIAFLIALFLLTRVTGLRIAACQYLSALSYTKNYWCSSWIDGHLWSLSVEEQFYVLWPVILTRAPRHIALVVALALICVAPISRAIEYLDGARSFFWLTSNLDALMIGCIAAIAFRAWPEAMQRAVSWRPTLCRGSAIAIIAIPGALSRHLLLGWFTVMVGPTIQALAVGYLICSFVLHRRGVGYDLLNLRPVTYVGVLSYSLYIWQEPFFSPPVLFGVDSSIFLIFPMNLLSVSLVAMLSYYLLEKPFASLRSRFRPPPEHFEPMDTANFNLL